MLAVKLPGCLGVFARHTLDAEEADPDERRTCDLVVVIRFCWIFALRLFLFGCFNKSAGRLRLFFLCLLFNLDKIS